jgi:hypothetical protein
VVQRYQSAQARQAHPVHQVRPQCQARQVRQACLLYLAGQHNPTCRELAQAPGTPDWAAVVSVPGSAVVSAAVWAPALVVVSEPDWATTSLTDNRDERRRSTRLRHTVYREVLALNMPSHRQHLKPCEFTQDSVAFDIHCAQLVLVQSLAQHTPASASHMPPKHYAHTLSLARENIAPTYLIIINACVSKRKRLHAPSGIAVTTSRAVTGAIARHRTRRVQCNANQALRVAQIAVALPLAIRRRRRRHRRQHDDTTTRIKTVRLHNTAKYALIA